MERFNLYKQMEEKLEVVPTVKHEMHFEINDMSKKMLDHESLSEQEIDVLETVYEKLQSLEENLIGSLEGQRSSAVISQEEFLIVADYFLVAKQQGPDSGSIKEFFLMNEPFDEEKFAETIQSISIPEYTKVILKEVYGKIGAAL